MTDETERPTIDSLLADRTRFESWLTQVESKAGHLPAHVVARVRADYETRLAGVLAALGERADELHAQLASLVERVSALEDALTATEDVRAEDELRALVGEYDDATWASRAAVHDAAIAAADEERRQVTIERDRVQAMLVDATRPTPVETAAVLDEARRGAGEPSHAPAVETASGATTMVPEPLAVPAEDAGRAASEPAVAEVEVDAPPALTSPATDDDARGATAPDEGSEPPLLGAAFGDLMPEPSFGAAPRRSSRTSSFDEIAFLDAVVGEGAAPAGGTPARADAEPSGVGESAPAGREPAHTPDTQRTLKCQECGWLNIPTEWYCEKCGGELSAF